MKVTDCPKTDGLADETTVVVVPASFTVWATAGRGARPEVPIPRVLRRQRARAHEERGVTSVACPAPVRVAVPSTVVPSVNVTVPVGVAGSGVAGDTVAVSVTASLTVEGFGVDRQRGHRRRVRHRQREVLRHGRPGRGARRDRETISSAVPAAGIPASVAVPSPLSVNVASAGSVPVAVSVTGGGPWVVTVKLPAVPTTNVVASTLVIVNPVRLGPATSAPPVNAGGKERSSPPPPPSPRRRRGRAGRPGAGPGDDVRDAIAGDVAAPTNTPPRNAGS